MKMTKPITLFLRCLAMIIMIGSPTIVFSQTAIIEAGKLAGFNRIIVNRSFYNIRFIDGSFDSIFGDYKGIDFNRVFEAVAASDALLAAIEEYPPLICIAGPPPTQQIA